MKANGLELKHIGSKSEPSPILASEELLDKIHTIFKDSALAVAWLDDKVLIGRLNGGRFHFFENQLLDSKYIQRIRVFKQDMEFLGWRVKNGFKGRLRSDEPTGSGTYVTVAHQLLFGTDANSKSKGFTEISEERGTRLIVPFENISIDQNDRRLFIKTHNYVAYNPMGQATYEDCRFVAFSDGEKTLD